MYVLATLPKIPLYFSVDKSSAERCSRTSVYSWYGRISGSLVVISHRHLLARQSWVEQRSHIWHWHWL